MKDDDIKGIVDELHKPIIRNFQRRKVYVDGANDTWGGDLVDMQQYKNENNGYAYTLNVIDIFSRYAFVIPIKDKTQETMIKAFKQLFKDNKPKYLWLDRGSEFIAKKVSAFLKDQDVGIYHTYSESKSVFAERFNRTIKGMMWKAFTLQRSYRWIDIIDGLVEEYNNKVHSSIKMSPKEAYKQKNHDKVYDIAFNDNLKPDVVSDFELGDTVRISKLKKTFEKGYLPSWSTELFKINRISYTHPITYGIEDLNQQDIEGSFYREELQKTKYPDMYLVEKIVDKRTKNGKKEVLIKWLGFENKKDLTWEKEKDVRDLINLQEKYLKE